MKKDLIGFEGIYFATKKGEIFSYKKYVKNSKRTGFFRKEQKIKPFVAAGYYYITLYKNGKKYKTSVHRIIAKTFVENKNNFPQVNHIDGNKLNNCVSNLEFVTPSQNAIHARNLGKLNGKLNLKKIAKIKFFLSIGTSQTKIAKLFNVTQATISEIKLNKTWKNI